MSTLPKTVILGENFLDDNDAVIDYSCHSLIIGNDTSDKHYMSFVTKSDDDFNGLATTIDEIFIPPQNEICFKVRLPVVIDNSLVLIEPVDSLSHHSEVAGGRTLSRSLSNVATFRLLNPSQEEKVIEKGTVVGKFSLIDDDSIFDIDFDKTFVSTLDTDQIKLDNDTTDYIKIAQDLGFDLTDSMLTTEQRRRLLVFLGQNRNIFSTSLADLGKTDMHERVIDTDNHPPVKCRP